MRKKRIYQLYVYPKDPFTNSIIVRHDLVNPYVDEVRDAMCSDGQRRNLWRISREGKSLLSRVIGAKFDVFSQEGLRGPIKPSYIDRRKVKKTIRTPKVFKASDLLK